MTEKEKRIEEIRLAGELEDIQCAMVELAQKLEDVKTQMLCASNSVD